MAGVLKALGSKADDAADLVKDLFFVRGTNQDDLARAIDQGGIPMPSIAVTQKDIPFTGFGDVQLIGNPASFAPESNAANRIFSADAYTVTQPIPFKKAKPGAAEQWEKDTRYLLDMGLDSDVLANWKYSLKQLEGKSPTAMDYIDLEHSGNNQAMIYMFAKDQGMSDEVLNKIVKDRKYATDFFFENRENIVSYIGRLRDKYLEPDAVFNVQDINFDAKSKVIPYTLDNATQAMIKYGGANQQQGLMTYNTAGRQLASTTQEFKSLDDVRANKGLLGLLGPEEHNKISEDLADEFFAIGEALGPYYGFNAQGLQYLEEVGKVMAGAQNKGIARSLADEGFSNVPKELIDRFQAYRDRMGSMPRSYFEAKPERAVSMTDFPGAIVQRPEYNKMIIDKLKAAGVQVEPVDSAEEAMAAREKFKHLMFSLGGATTLGGALFGNQNQPPGAN